MSGLVSGYSGIIAPPNLATNGAFWINQRNKFLNSVSPVAINDYVTDAWSVDIIDVDYLSCSNNNNDSQGPYLHFEGYGKKGQTFRIISKDHGSDFTGNFNDSSPPLIQTTSSIHAKTAGPCIGVNIEPIGKMAWGHGPYKKLHDASKVVSSSNPRVFASSIYETRMHYTSSNLGPFVVFTLMEDGVFNFDIGHFVMSAGAFKNPPKYAPVPYADDLARCQRYYQKGKSKAFGARESASNYHVGSYVGFPTVMTSTPSISLSNIYTAENGIDGNKFVTNGYTSYINTNTVEGFFGGVRKGKTGVFPDEVVFDWTAEVV